MGRGVEDRVSVAGALRDGGTEALSDVYVRWSPLVYSLALRALGDVAAAEDVTKEVFTELWASRGTSEASRSSFSAWLVDLSRARIAEAGRLRTASASPARDRDEESRDDESRSVVMAERLLVADGLAHLDAGPRRVLRMVLDDLSPAEVAARTGLSVDDVKSQVASSLIQLRQRWEVPRDAH